MYNHIKKRYEKRQSDGIKSHKFQRHLFINEFLYLSVLIWGAGIHAPFFLVFSGSKSWSGWFYWTVVNISLELKWICWSRFWWYIHIGSLVGRSCRFDPHISDNNKSKESLMSRVVQILNFSPAFDSSWRSRNGNKTSATKVARTCPKVFQF